MSLRLLSTFFAFAFLPLVACTTTVVEFKENDYVPEYVAKFKDTKIKHLVLDTKMSPEKQEAMIEAATAWETAVGGGCSLHFEVTVADVDDRDPPAGVITVRENHNEGYAGYAWWNLPGGRIQMEPSLNIDQFVVVGKHELGHTLELLHEDGGIMSDKSVITEDNARRVCQLIDPLALTPRAGLAIGHCATEATDTP